MIQDYIFLSYVSRPAARTLSLPAGYLTFSRTSPTNSFLCCESNILFIEKLQQYKASSYDDVYIRLDTMILIPIPIFSLKRSAETSIQGE